MIETRQIYILVPTIRLKPSMPRAPQILEVLITNILTNISSTSKNVKNILGVLFRLVWPHIVLWAHIWDIGPLIAVPP